ncbi:MAG: hypothetical protein ACOYMA_18900, partial [Bacteroidia bacterium]
MILLTDCPKANGRAFGNFALKNQTNGISGGTGKRSRSHDRKYTIRRKCFIRDGLERAGDSRRLILAKL